MEDKKDLEIEVNILNRQLKEYQGALMSFMECIQFMPFEAPCLPELRKDFDNIWDRVKETKIRLLNACLKYKAAEKNG